MKKSDRKTKTLKLNRETLVRLDAENLSKAQGGLLQQNVLECTGCDSGCGIFPNTD
jgi:hypothetical protein